MSFAERTWIARLDPQLTRGAAARRDDQGPGQPASGVAPRGAAAYRASLLAGACAVSDVETETVALPRTMYESAGQIAADEYGISRGQTWGAAPSHVQAEWTPVRRRRSLRAAAAA